jgi:hypothetical protein
MSKPAIKYRLDRWERALAFQVLEQDERLLAAKEVTAGGLGVSVRVYIAMHPTWLCPRGTSCGNDFAVATLTFPNNAERDAYAAKLGPAIQAWVDANRHLLVEGEPREGCRLTDDEWLGACEVYDSTGISTRASVHSLLDAEAKARGLTGWECYGEYTKTGFATHPETPGIVEVW